MNMRIKPSKIIKTLLDSQRNVIETAHILKISRATIYRWIVRARTYKGKLKQRGLHRLSTKPHKIYTAISLSEQDSIVKLRKETGYSAVKIKHELHLSVGVNTIHRFIKRRGLLNLYGNHRRPYYQKTTHMHLGNTKQVGYLQMDVKYLTPQLTGLAYTCFEYAVIDIFSRYKDAVILNQLDNHGATHALLEILTRLPFKPVFIQTDNGLEFQGIFNEIVLSKGLKHHYVHKNTPNENAVIERSFRTDEEEFFFFRYKGAKHYDDLRDQFASFLHFYNTERPHLGINLQTPLEVVSHVVGD
jgi:IS30 family transposase